MREQGEQREVEEVQPADYLERWYIGPILALKKIDRGDGGFAALALSISAYDRHVLAIVRRMSPATQEVDGKTVGKLMIEEIRAYDNSQLDDETSLCFRKVFRNGLMHAGLPSVLMARHKGVISWDFSESYKKAIETRKAGGDIQFLINPWNFADFVITSWQKHANEFMLPGTRDRIITYTTYPSTKGESS